MEPPRVSTCTGDTLPVPSRRGMSGASFTQSSRSSRPMLVVRQLPRPSMPQPPHRHRASHTAHFIIRRTALVAGLTA